MNTATMRRSCLMARTLRPRADELTSIGAISRHRMYSQSLCRPEQTLQTSNSSLAVSSIGPNTYFRADFRKDISVLGSRLYMATITNGLPKSTYQTFRSYVNNSRKNNSRSSNRSGDKGGDNTPPDFQSLMRTFYKRAHPDIIRSYDADKVCLLLFVLVFLLCLTSFCLSFFFLVIFV